MNSQIWREHPWWWGPPLALLVVNVVLLVWFQAVYSGAARNVDQQLERRHAELATPGAWSELCVTYSSSVRMVLGPRILVIRL